MPTVSLLTERMRAIAVRVYLHASSFCAGNVEIKKRFRNNYTYSTGASTNAGIFSH